MITQNKTSYTEKIMNFLFTTNAKENTTSVVTLILLMVATIFIVYSPSITGEFIAFDDNVYVYQNIQVQKGLSAENIQWSFYTTTDGNWFPLTWLSYMLDVSIAGNFKATTFHISNIVYHSVNSILAFTALYLMTGAIGRSFIVAGLFALHPLHVESVAWIAERKDLLSAFFFFLTLIAYTRYLKQRSTARYLATLSLFTCGLMSKPMLVSVPLLLLLLDYWPFQRFKSFSEREFRQVIYEKIPFYFLSVISCIITYYVQKQKAIVNYETSPLTLNIKNAAVSYVDYLHKTFIPLKLAVLYPFPAHISILKVALATLFLGFCTFMAIRLTKDKKHVIVGWLWFLISLLPVIGIIRVGTQAMADRYTYIPLVGIFILLVWEISDSTFVKKISINVRTTIVAFIFSVLAVLTWTQTGHWRSTFSLFSHAVNVTENNWVALGVLSEYYASRNDNKMEYETLSKSLAIFPQNASAQLRMGMLQFRMGDREQAIAAYKKAVEIDPLQSLAHYQLGLQLSSKGDTARAFKQYTILKDLDPDFARQLLSHIQIQNHSRQSKVQQ